MANIRIDIYYDITCDRCGRRWSRNKVDDQETDIFLLRKLAKTKGWRNKKGETLCPECARQKKR